MTGKKESSLFSNMFSNKKVSDNSDNSDNPASDELLQCLHNLSSVNEGQDRKVDHEISQFKKMIKIGSSASELQKQVTIIADKLAQAAALPKNNQLVKYFQQMPAEILLDEILNCPLSGTIEPKLINYKNSLNTSSLAISSLSDIIGIFETERPIADSADNVSVDEPNLTEVADPLFKLFAQLELPTGQDDYLEDMVTQSNQINNLDGLIGLIEELSYLIFSSIIRSKGQFESFLVQLKLRLDKVNQSILSGGETSAALSSCSDSFSQQVSSQVNEIQTIVKTENITDLKEIISQSLESLVAGVHNFDKDRKELEIEAEQTILKLKQELKQTQSEAASLKDHLQLQKHRALTDSLTNLPNRQAYNERMHLEFTRWNRYDKPLSFIITDIDLFKDVNDNLGHLVGDSVLQEIAKLLKREIRETDFVARFGGEEFVIIMPETNLTDATKAANKIRLNIQSHKIGGEAEAIKITMSFGVAQFETDDTIKSVLARADIALYRAKDKGRNQVCVQRKIK